MVNTQVNLRAVLSSERTPPASLEAERAAIGCVLLRGELIGDFEDLRPGDFFLPAHVEIWGCIREMQQQGRPIDIVALADKLRAAGALPRLENGESYLLTCADAVPHAENAGHYARIIQQKAGLRRTIHLCASVMGRAYMGVDLDDVLAEARTGVADLELAGGGEGPVQVNETTMQTALDTIIARAESGATTSVRTGIRKFDETTGGLRPETLTVVAGPPGMGKTAWAATVLVHNARQGIPALLLSLEMGRQDIIERLLAMEARISTTEIASGRIVGTPQFSRELYPAAGRIGALPLWVDDRDALTLGQAIGTIRRWYTKVLGSVPPQSAPPRPAIVALDYIQLLTSDNAADDDDRNKAIGKMTRALKKLSKTLRIPVVVLSQLNRTHAKRGGPPVLSDLRDSGALEQDADMVVFPWREPLKDSKGASAAPPSGSGPGYWIAAKNRNGPTGFFPTYWHAPYTSFENPDTELLDR
jgi:replicative DNA helicase